MKKIITVFIFCFLCGECFSQAGEWVWIKGDSIPNQPGNYGVQGVPSPTNSPSALYEPCEWTDLNGNFWLWGGNEGNNDLWKYNPVTNEWTWMKSGPANYGIQGVSSPNNNPPPRLFAPASWVDAIGNLWMFGGYDTAATANAYYNDLWKYNISTNEWTWMKGPNVSGQLGQYGIQGVPDILNNPAGRSECATAWTDNAGDLWLFGGGTASFLNDLWRYNIATNQWTWMKGSPSFFQNGFHGVQGIENSMNTPRSQMAHCRWKDNSGKLWLFGGDNNAGTYNTLWRYNVDNNSWAWMGGDSIGNATGSYGTKCLSSVANNPGARYENRAAWKDPKGNLWFFGGVKAGLGGGSKNDLWMYCMVTNQWIWMSGDSTFNPWGNWGTIGISSPTNRPNRRFGSVGWTDNNGHLYFFGGFGHYNDLWKYTIDSTCGVCPAPNSIQENNFTNELLVFPNPSNSSLTISFSSSEKQTVELRIYNTLGELNLFQSFKTLEKVFSTEINVEKWSEGIYFLQLKTKEGILNRKVVVQD